MIIKPKVTPLRVHPSTYFIPDRLGFLLCSKPLKVGDCFVSCGKCFYCRNKDKEDKK